MPKQIWKINQFHGGLNSSSDPRDVADNELTEAVDCMVNELGRVRPMGGAVEHSISNTGLYGQHTGGYGLFPFSHDVTGGNDMFGVLTVDNITEVTEIEE